MSRSPAETLAALGPEEWERHLSALGEAGAAALLRDWAFWARPAQRTPTEAFRWWAFMTGRGAGKTRAGAEYVWDRCEAFAAAGHAHRGALVGATFDDVRVLQITGESGLVPVAERRGHHVDHASTGREAKLTVNTRRGPHTSIFEIHTALEPDRLRGRNAHTIWMEEFSTWKTKTDVVGNTAFTNADLSMRALCPPGMQPQGIATFTPKPIKPVKDLVAGKFGATVVRTGSLYDNLSNLDPAYVETILSHYAHTRLAAQEIEGLLLDAVEGALWTPAAVERTRIEDPSKTPPLLRIVVGVDPPGGLKTECGIVVAGVAWGVSVLAPEWAGGGENAKDRLHLYILDDRSISGPPETWGQEAIAAYRYWSADCLAVESNFGGEMVRSTIHLQDANVPVKTVHSSRGKQLRAEPVSSLWGEQRRGHVVGYWGAMEAEWTTWVPLDPLSPNRLDASVFAAAELIPDLQVAANTTAYGSIVAAAQIHG